MPPIPTTSSLALKEWAVAVEALGTGKQILVLRKGGIDRSDKDFRIVHPEFLLYPTHEHQRAALLKPEYRDDLARIPTKDDVTEPVELGFWVRVTDKFELRDEAELARLSRFHIWTDDYAQKRLYWRPKYPLTVAFLRVYSMREVQLMDVTDEYLGCKSWVELRQSLPLGELAPVLDDDEYEARARAVREAMADVAPVPLEA